MYFYGYIFAPIPGGWLASRYGGRRVWGICQAICSLFTLAMPLAARAHVYFAYAIRFFLGLVAGVSLPCLYSRMGRWAPKLERSKLMSFCATGYPAGNILTFSLSALLCVYGFDNGWGSIFYLTGVGNLVWVVVWFVVTADTPAKHKWISEVERNYIQSSIGETFEKKVTLLPTPWRAIFTSIPFWASVMADMSAMFTAYTLLTSLPAFMKEVLKFDIKQNGGLSALPFVCEPVMSALSGQVADRLRESGVLSAKNTRKLFQFMAPALGSQRWNLAILCFLGNVLVYTSRVNLSVAIICMVRAPHVNVTSATLKNDGKHGLTSEVSSAPDMTFDTITAEKNGTAQTDCGLKNMKPIVLFNDGEFDWDKETQSLFLAMYFYGFIFTPITGGWLASRYGGRRVMGICQAICAFSTLAMPLAARAHVYFAYAIRFFLGLVAGVSPPCVYSMMGRWAPKLERSKLLSFCTTGYPAGNILTFSLSALLCVYGFDNGWGSIFYLTGVGNLVWVAVWFIVTADTPAKHKWISDAERNYIQSSIGETLEKKETLVPTPWRAIFTSIPFWVSVIADMSAMFTAFTLLTSLPAFMKEVLKFDIKQNGGLSALPFVCEAVMSALSGQVADRLRARGVLSTKNTRKLFQFMASFGSATCIVSAGYMNCTQRPLVVFLLCLCLCFHGLNSAACRVSHFDLAPRHAGVMSGTSTTAAIASGMVAPLVVGALTPNGTVEEWRHVFYVCAAFSTTGAIVYGIFAEGELQTWAGPQPAKNIVEYHRVDGGDIHVTSDHTNDTLRDITANTAALPVVDGSKSNILEPK